jgi:hypothetical protein
MLEGWKVMADPTKTSENEVQRQFQSFHSNRVDRINEGWRIRWTELVTCTRGMRIP